MSSRFVPAVLLALGLLGCHGSGGHGGAGGATGSGGTLAGTTDAGGTSSAGGTSVGGATSVGGTTGAGGTNGANGTTSGGGTSNAGRTSSAGGATGSGGAARAGGVTGGAAGEGGAIGSGGRIGSGGASASGGTTSSGGADGGATSTGGTSAPGSCDQGTTTTTWASNCPTSGQSCTAGTWVAGGPENDSCCSAMTLRAESAHFAVYADESSTTATTAQGAVDHLETVWSLDFGSPLYMREPFCNSATKYKANIHVHSTWGLTGGGFGTGRMGMWIGTGGLSDHWGLAHEFMHGVQSVEGGMVCNQSNTCGWVYESHANWAAQQQLEYHTTDVHCSELLVNAPHLYLGSTRDRYCNWQFMEYLKDKYCYSAVNAIWMGTAANDPFTAIMNAQKWTISQLNDFLGEWAMHNVTWDYQDPAPESTAGGNQGALFRRSYGLLTDTSNKSKPERHIRLAQLEPLDANWASNRRFQSPYFWAPQRWGYNIVRLLPETGVTSVTVTFRGITGGPNPDWRWGLVATDAGITTPRYSALQKGSDGQLVFCVKSGESLWLVVMATPSVQQQFVWDQAYASIPRYPYMVQLEGAWPDAFQGGVQAACPSGLSRVANGGGCGPASLPATVYVGPYATVLGGTVSGDARVDDHATVWSGTVSGGTVGALTMVSNFTVAPSATAKTTFYPLGYFETGNSISGTAVIYGDVEFRGPNYVLTSTQCSGFIQAAQGSSPASCGTDAGGLAPKGTATISDVNAAPPYTWRP